MRKNKLMLSHNNKKRARKVPTPLTLSKLSRHLTTRIYVSESWWNLDSMHSMQIITENGKEYVLIFRASSRKRGNKGGRIYPKKSSSLPIKIPRENYQER